MKIQISHLPKRSKNWEHCAPFTAPGLILAKVETTKRLYSFGNMPSDMSNAVYQMVAGNELFITSLTGTTYRIHITN